MQTVMKTSANILIDSIPNDNAELSAYQIVNWLVLIGKCEATLYVI